MNNEELHNDSRCAILIILAFSFINCVYLSEKIFLLEKRVNKQEQHIHEIMNENDKQRQTYISHF